MPKCLRGCPEDPEYEALLNLALWNLPNFASKPGARPMITPLQAPAGCAGQRRADVAPHADTFGAVFNCWSMQQSNTVDIPLVPAVLSFMAVHHGKLAPMLKKSD